jgi:glycosyltransferase involved in cell wall biosynthesis
MKILIDCREIQKNTTGIARFLLSLFKGIKSFNIEYEFLLLGNQYTDFERKELDGYEKIVVEEKNTFYFDQVVILQVIKEQKIDLFFSPYYKFPVFTKVPVTTSIFDVMYLVLDEYKNDIKNIYRKNFIKLTYKKVNKVITSSNFAKNEIMKVLNLPDEKIDVVYLSVDEKFKPQPAEKIKEIKEKYGISKNYILYVGNAKPHKNLNRLLSAWQLIDEEIKKDYILVLAGVGQKFCYKDEDILIIPFVSEEELPVLYTGATVFVFPSIYEGFGLPPLEAMACGCPVVCSNVSSMTEILGDACLYFNPYDVNQISKTILEILHSETLREKLRKEGFEKVKSYSLEKMVNSLIKIFESI